MRSVVPLSPKEATESALRLVDSSINAGINPNKAIASVAKAKSIDPQKLEALYIDRGRTAPVGNGIAGAPDQA